MLNRFIKVSAVIVSLLIPAVLYAAPTVGVQYAPSILPINDDTYYLGSSSPSLQWKGAYIKDLVVSNCTGCGTASGGGTGNVSTSTAETAGGLAYWTSNSATPALLGEVATGTISTSGGITTTNGSYVVGSGLTIGCTTATGSVPGCLSAADWTTFNSKNGWAYPWIPVAGGVASTTLFYNYGGIYALGSSTIQYASTTNISSTGGAQLATAGGNVGIGTTTPASPLAVSANTTGPTAYFFNTNSTGSGNGVLIDTNSTSGTDNYVLNVRSNLQSILYAREDGKVGIGTTSPMGILSIVPSADTIAGGLIIQRAGTPGQYGSISQAGGAFNFYSSNSNALGTGNQIIFGQIGAGVSREIARFDTAGNLGVGTAGPQNKLDVNGAVAIGSFAGVNAATSNGLIVSGNIGAGTSSPLWVLNPYSVTGPQLALSNGAGIAQWTFRNAGGNLYLSTTTPQGLATTSSTAFMIDGASGKTGIGTSSPYSLLSVGGSTAVSSLNVDGAGTSTKILGNVQVTGDVCNTLGCLGFSGGGATYIPGVATTSEQDLATTTLDFSSLSASDLDFDFIATSTTVAVDIPYIVVYFNNFNYKAGEYTAVWLTKDVVGALSTDCTGGEATSQDYIKIGCPGISSILHNITNVEITGHIYSNTNKIKVVNLTMRVNAYIFRANYTYTQATPAALTKITVAIPIATSKFAWGTHMSVIKWR